MTTYIVEVPDGGDYRKVEVEADSAWNDSYGLTFEREKKVVAMFRDWICFYRTEVDVKPEIKVTVHGTGLASAIAWTAPVASEYHAAKWAVQS